MNPQAMTYGNNMLQRCLGLAADVGAETHRETKEHETLAREQT